MSTKEEKTFNGNKTIGEILDTLNEEQKAAVAYLLYQAKNSKDKKIK